MQFLLLGPLEVPGDHGPLDLGGPLQRTILAYLVLRRGEHVRSEEVIDGVWGDEAPAAVRQSLQSYVSRLRKLIGADRIEGRAGGYTLVADAEEVDAAVFERLVAEARSAAASDPTAAGRLYTEAEALWRGAALADLRDQPGLRADVVRLDELRLAALEEHMGVELALGRHQEIAPRLEQLVQRHPQREGLWRNLMVALYRSGRQTEALAAYHTLRSELADRLGIDPSPELELLQRRILDHDPTLEVESRPLRGYRLLQRVGRGSVGVVHRALQPDVDRAVAVKIIDERLADDPDFIRRFETEARRVARLDHPHIAPIHDYWREPGAAYIVTPLFERGSLAEALDHADLDAATLTGIVEQVASAVSFAHRRDVLHGNLHPGNVLLDGDANAYVSGFAAGLRGIDDVAPGVLPPTHVAPEVRADRRATVRADVYSIGRLIASMHGQLADERILAVARRATATDPAERFDTVDDLLVAIVAERADSVGRPAAAPTDVAVRNPYKGLLPFNNADAADFHGRETLVDEVVARLGDDHRLVVVVGPSGSGKSSLVRAGVLPALANGALQTSKDWFVVEMVPGTRPFAELNEAVRSIARSPTWHPASDAAHDLTTLVDHALPDTDDTVLVVMDQLEELYTLTGPEDRAAFIDAIVSAASAPEGRIRFLATLRADFYDQPLDHAELADLVAHGTVAVRPMTAAELGQAIAAPAAGVGVEVDAALVANLTDDLVDEPGALPLLQYALREMFKARDDGRMDMSSYETVDGLTGALTRRAEDLWAGLSPATRDLAPQLFLRLVTVTDTGVTRRRALRRALREIGGDATIVEQLLTDFGDARLLSFDRDPVTRDPTVEVAHEALLREWKRLRGWIDDARGDLLQHHALTRAAEDWDDADRDPSFLAGGTRLEQLDSWRQQTTLPLSATERAFLDESVARRDRERDEQARQQARERALERRAHRRLRVIVAVLALSAVLGSVVTAFAVVQRNDARRQARVAMARQLAAASAAALPIDVERSILLALEAVEATRSEDGEVLPEAEQALHTAVSSSRLIARLPSIGGHLSVSPDGSMVVTEGPEDTGIIDIRDLATGETLHSFVGHDAGADGRPPDINAVSFSPDGTRLATAGDDGTLRVWGDVWNDHGTEPELLIGDEPSIVWQPTFSRTGDLVAAAWMNDDRRVTDDGDVDEYGHVRVIEVSSGDVLIERAFPAPIGASLSPDGDRLAVLDGDVGVVVLPILAGSQTPELPIDDDVDANQMGVAWSPDGRWLAAVDGTEARVWDGRTGELLAVGMAKAHLLGLGWNSDSTQLAAGDLRGRAYVWSIDPPVARLRHEFADAASPTPGIAFNPGSDQVLIGAEGVAATATTWVWDLSTAGGGEIRNIAVSEVPWTQADFAGDRDSAVVVGDGGAMTVWDLTNGAVVQTVQPSETDGAWAADWSHRVVTSSDGRLLGWSAGNHARGWDLEEDVELFEIVDDGPLSGIAWTPDARHAAIGSRNGIRIVASDGTEASRWPILGADGAEEEDAHYDLAFSPDGDLLAVGVFVQFQPETARIELWDWRDQRLVRVIDTRPWGRLPAFSPDGSWVAVGGVEPTEVFDVATGEGVRELPEDSAGARTIAVSPDGSTIATAGVARVVRLWDASTGRMRLELPEHEGEVFSVAFSPDGSRLISGDDAGSVHVWALELDELIDIAESRLTRGLTPGECLQFLGLESCPDA